MASSTLIESEIVSLSGTNNKYPEVGFGVVGRNTLIEFLEISELISPYGSEVTNTIE